MSDAVAMLLAGGLAVASTRATVAASTARARAGGLPLRWCRWPGVALMAHDAVLGAGVFTLLVGLPSRLLPPGWLLSPDLSSASGWLPWPGRTAAGNALLLAGIAISIWITGWLLDRRRDLPFPGRSRAAGEPSVDWRGRLLIGVERAAARSASRWIGQRLDRCRRSAGTTVDNLLPAACTPARVQLRQATLGGRTEVALLLLQAQAVMDDAAPAQERLLTLLHLVHAHAGRSGVRHVLHQAERAPIRSGRTELTAWGATPG